MNEVSNRGVRKVLGGVQKACSTQEVQTSGLNEVTGNFRLFA